VRSAETRLTTPPSSGVVRWLKAEKRQIADVLAERFRIPLLEGGAVEAYLAAHRRPDADEQPGERRLARGARPNDAEPVAGLERKGDERNDTLFVRFTETDIIESEEISPGLILDYDGDGRIVALEFLNASKKIAGEATLKEVAA
jgi:uncharacterized protein YuzE